MEFQLDNDNALSISLLILYSRQSLHFIKLYLLYESVNLNNTALVIQ